MGQDVFTRIYLKNSWGCAESVSGPSSTMARTENLRKSFPNLLTDYNITSVFDAPCGDLNWMQELLKTIDIEYIGGDIVLPMINMHKKQYEKFAENKKYKFMWIDLTKSLFPKADLMLCRDLIFHLSYEDTNRLINNLKKSDISYFLTTTHRKSIMLEKKVSNKNIKTGEWRYMDLLDHPYNFPEPLDRIIDGGGDRELCLWSISQILALKEIII